jgi:hypothetical protein
MPVGDYMSFGEEELRGAGCAAHVYDAWNATHTAGDVYETTGSPLRGVAAGMFSVRAIKNKSASSRTNPRHREQIIDNK